MKTLKFRVWDKSLNRFLPLEDSYGKVVSPLLDISGRLWNWASQHWGIDNELVKNQDNYIIQQFTGLLDKNGKEIYEGDIIKIKTYSVGYVSYLEESACYILRWSHPAYRLDLHLLDELEIIGNIYENPPEWFK